MRYWFGWLVWPLVCGLNTDEILGSSANLQTEPPPKLRDKLGFLVRNHILRNTMNLEDVVYNHPCRLPGKQEFGNRNEVDRFGETFQNVGITVFLLVGGRMVTNLF